MPLEVAHLILVQHMPMAIRFRFDEKRFDIDGAYNMRYEIVKKRIDKALYIEVPDDELVQRLSSRWMCRQCGAIYNAISDPPKQAGVCDRCTGELYQRDDDKPETVRRRLQVMKPPSDMIEHYESAGKLRRIDGLRSIEAVTAGLLTEIEG